MDNFLTKQIIFVWSLKKRWTPPNPPAQGVHVVNQIQNNGHDFFCTFLAKSSIVSNPNWWAMFSNWNRLLLILIRRVIKSCRSRQFPTATMMTERNEPGIDGWLSGGVDAWQWKRAEICWNRRRMMVGLRWRPSRAGDRKLYKWSDLIRIASQPWSWVLVFLTMTTENCIKWFLSL